MNASARFCLLYNLRNMLHTLKLCVFNVPILHKRTFLTFILSKHDIIANLMSDYAYDARDKKMTFCNCNIIVASHLQVYI